MGVRIAARLMRGQGGDLWVQARPGGGTSYGICLPALGERNGEDEVPETSDSLRREDPGCPGC